MWEKLERVIKSCGVKITYIEDFCGICRNTLYHYRIGNLVLKGEKLEKMKKYLEMFNI